MSNSSDNPSIPSKAYIDALSGFFVMYGSPETKIRVAQSPFVSREFMVAFSKDEDPVVSDLAATYFQTPVAKKRIREYSIPLKLRLAITSTTPPEVLAVLANDFFTSVRACVAANPNTHYSVIDKVLSHDASLHVRKRAFRNHRLSSNRIWEILRELGDSGNPGGEENREIIFALSENVALSPVQLEVLAHFNEDTNILRDSILLHPAVTPSLLVFIEEKHPDLSSEVNQRRVIYGWEAPQEERVGVRT